MPHKRAKHSERVADKERRGRDLPPSSDVHFQSLPKGAMRILNAAQIQADYRQRKAEKEKQEVKKHKRKDNREQLKIRDGERIVDFHRRVESEMAKDVRSSIRATTKASKKRKSSSERNENEEDDNLNSRDSVKLLQKADARGSNARQSDKVSQERIKVRSKDQLKDWQKAEKRRRINDVVKAPPILTRAPRGESSEAKQRKRKLQALLEGKEDQSNLETSESVRLPHPVVKEGGLRRKAVLKEEREKAIQAYRLSKGKMENAFM